MWNAFAHGRRQLRHDRRRYAIAGAALVLGVALLLGTLLTTQSIGQRLSDGVSSLGGLGDVGVVPTLNGTTVAATDVAAVEALPGVETAVPTFSRRTALRADTTGADEHELMVTGYPASLGERLVGLSVDGRLPAPGAAEVLVPTDVAERLGVTVGENVVVAGSAGSTTLAVVGLVDPDELGTLAADNVFVDLPTAQTLFSAPGRLTRIDLLLAADRTSDAWQGEFAGELPTGLQVQDTSALSESFGPLLSAITVVLVAAAAVVLAISALLAAVAFDGVIRSRRTTYGLMRVVGASGADLARTVMAEALLLIAVCTALGLVVGLGVSWGLERLLTSVGDLPPGGVGLDAVSVATAAAVGLLAGLAGAGRAILRVLRRPPAATLAEIDTATPRPAASGRTVPLLVGGGLVAVGVVAFFTPSDAVKLVGLASLLAAAAVLAPVLLAACTGAPGLDRLFQGRDWAGHVAARRMHRHRGLGSTTAITTAVVCLSASLVVGVSAIGSAMQTQITRQFGADVQVSSSVPVDGAVDEVLAAAPGVAAVSGTVTDVAEIDAGGTTSEVSLRAVETSTYFETAQVPWRAGDDSATPAAMQAQDAVVVPASLAEARGLSLGDPVVLRRSDATVTLEVVGTYASLVTGNQVIVSRATGAELGVTGTTAWNVGASDGTDVAVLRDELADALGATPGISVVTAAEMRERAGAELASYVLAAFAVVVLALGLGSIGAGGVLALGVSQREREIGVLRAVGATRRSVRRLVVWEALFVALAASVVGLVLGQVSGGLLTQVLAGALGATLDVPVEPLGFAAIALVTVVTLCLAAVVPSRRAGRVDPALSLRAE